MAYKEPRKVNINRSLSEVLHFVRHPDLSTHQDQQTKT